MPFKTILKDLVVSVPGATGAILADWEGEAVEQYCLYDDYEIKITAAHKSIILNRIKEVHAALSTGDLHDTVITTDLLHVVAGVVGPEYSLVMTLEKGVVIGCAMRYFRNAVKLLEKEIY